MTTYLAFQALYGENEITEEYAKDWEIDNAHIRDLRLADLRRRTQ